MVIAYCILSLILVLLGMLDGRKQGYPRKACSILAILGAILSAYVLQDIGVSLLKRWLAYPELVLLPLGSLMVAIIAFAAIHCLGVIFFKKTEDVPEEKQPSYARAGAALGGFFGLAIAVLLLSTLKMSGGLAASFVRIYEPQLNATGETSSAQTSIQRHAINSLKWVSSTNESLKDLPGYSALTVVAPLQEEELAVFDKTLEVLSKPEAVQHISQQPGIQSFLEMPALQQMAQDKEVRKLAEKKDFHKLLSHPSVRAAIDNPEFRKKFSEFNFEAALDAALSHDSGTQDHSSGNIPYQQIQTVMPEQ